MKKLLIGLLLITLSMIYGATIEGETHDNVTVSITSVFDGDNSDLVNTLSNQSYGSKISLDNQLSNDSNYRFVYWVVNGVVKEDLSVDHAFTLTTDLELVAVFSPLDSYAVLLMDSNGALLDTQYLLPGGDVEDITTNLPSKPGYTVSLTNKWSESLTNINDDKVIVLQYDKLTTDTFSVNVSRGSGSGTYDYNELISVTAEDDSSNEFFNYWTLDGSIVSYERDYTFTVLNDIALEAVFTSNTVTKENLITISDDLSLRDGYITFKGQFELTDGYELIEYGMITSRTESTPTLDNANRYQGKTLVPSSNEWLMSFNIDHHRYVRSYMTVKHDEGQITTLYSEIVTASDSYYTVTISDTIDNTLVSVNNPSPNLMGDFISLSSDTVNGYDFEHFIDLDTLEILSQTPTHALTVLRDYHIEAVYIEEGYTDIYMYSNISTPLVTYSSDGPYALNSTVTLTASDSGDYVFDHWLDASSDTVLSTQDSFDLTMDDSYYIIAVYKEAGGTETIYQTGFEDASKGSYASGFITTNNKVWYFNDALVGNLASDLKNGSKSVRAKNSIQTEFTLSQVNQVSFYTGSFSNDSNATLYTEISKDLTTWYTIDTYETTNQLVLREISLTESDYSSFGLSSSDSIYFRFRKVGGDRVNIDDVTFNAEGYETINNPTIFKTEDASFPNNSSRLTISFDDSFDPYYGLNDPFTGDGCVATDEFIGEVDCAMYGSVDTSILGEQEVIYYAIDPDGNYASQEVSYIVVTDDAYLEVDYTGYYDGIEGLYGEALINALRTIINNGFIGITYGDSRYILDESDQDPNNPDNLILLYLQTSVSGTWDAGATWNREHIWPQSKLGTGASNGSANIASDLHNLAPANPSENSSRSNRYYFTSMTSETYYPEYDVSRGYVARALFYMVVMYDYLELVNTVPNEYQMGHLDTLINWHLNYEVTSFEENRNEVIYSYQGNRNPFIDYPYLLELIYYDHPNLIVD
ncbi:MAG: endonuclease I family protein [Candidatus Izemoplasmataceae bacterium]